MQVEVQDNAQIRF